MGRGRQWSSDHVVRSCEASLKRLGVDAIDIYTQHRVDPETPVEETVGALSRLVEVGKVRYIGLSEAGPETIGKAHAIHPLVCIETEYSLWSRDVEEYILPLCRKLGISLMPYAPLGRGFLSGSIRSTADLVPGDTRTRCRGSAAKISTSTWLKCRVLKRSLLLRAQGRASCVAWSATR